MGVNVSSGKAVSVLLSPIVSNKVLELRMAKSMINILDTNCTHGKFTRTNYRTQGEGLYLLHPSYLFNILDIKSESGFEVMSLVHSLSAYIFESGTQR